MSYICYSQLPHSCFIFTERRVLVLTVPSQPECCCCCFSLNECTLIFFPSYGLLGSLENILRLFTFTIYIFPPNDLVQNYFPLCEILSLKLLICRFFSLNKHNWVMNIFVYCTTNFYYCASSPLLF